MQVTTQSSLRLRPALVTPVRDLTTERTKRTSNVQRPTNVKEFGVAQSPRVTVTKILSNRIFFAFSHHIYVYPKRIQVIKTRYALLRNVVKHKKPENCLSVVVTFKMFTLPLFTSY